MPEFNLNAPDKAAHPFYALDDFARAYVEAMFFTNGDTGDERENLLNDMGVERLTRASVESIASDCAEFQRDNADDLAAIYAAEPGRYSNGDALDDRRAGHLFWYARQGHGVAWTDHHAPDESTYDTLTRLQDASRVFGQSNVETWRGWIHVRGAWRRPLQVAA